MKHFTKVTSFVAIATALAGAPVFAEGPGMGHKGMGPGHRMGTSEQGTKKGMGSTEMHKKMQELHDHSKKMEGIKDEKQLTTEMRKHMKMTDEMMEHMMGAHEGTTTGPEEATEPEHSEHPAPKAE